MKISTKIRAFTLNEMIVVLILTSIVVGLVFTVLTILQRRFHDIQQRFERQAEKQKLEQSLWIDFNRYSSINYNMSTDELFFMSEIDAVKYQFHKDIIVKNRDTFKIKAAQKTFFFMGDKTQHGEIDAMKLRSSKNGIDQTFFFSKKNDATLFMKK